MVFPIWFLFLLRMNLCLVYEYEYFVCMYVCATHVCLVFAQVRRKCQILWNWSYKQLLASVLVLGLKPGSSAKTSTLNYCHVSRPSYMAFYCSPVTVFLLQYTRITFALHSSGHTCGGSFLFDWLW